jgi:NAD(P)-dependent dehydrogenase (short-subunit alcohol dehydrogenase family)
MALLVYTSILISTTERGMKRFTEMSVLITGGATGIGAACAERFASEGADVAVVDTNGEGAERTAARCREEGVRTLVFQEDVRNADRAQDIVSDLERQWGRIDVLVCSAGIYSGSPLEEVSLEDWHGVLETNLTGTFHYNRAVASLMRARGGGSIINISSMAGKTSWPATAQYSSSKSGVIGLTRSVAMELAPYGVTANAVCPGNTRTPMVKTVAAIVGARDGLSAEQWLETRASDCPMGRLAEPWEIAGVTAFLASEDSRYMTGQALAVDGGMVLS